MAQKTIFVDDLDGSTQDVQQISLTYKGTAYVLDLGPTNRAELDRALDRFLAVATKATSRTVRRPARRKRPAPKQPVAEPSCAEGGEQQ